MVALFMGFFKNVMPLNDEGLLYRYTLELFIACKILSSMLSTIHLLCL